jgi:hypothetical protein
MLIRGLVVPTISDNSSEELLQLSIEPFPTGRAPIDQRATLLRFEWLAAANTVARIMRKLGGDASAWSRTSLAISTSIFFLSGPG